MRKQKLLYDQLWIQNRFRKRKKVDGSHSKKDPATGFLESRNRLGFDAAKKRQFIQRLRICSNKTAIARSLHIDIQAVYDAVCIDSLFREQMIECEAIEGRLKKLEGALETAQKADSAQLVTDLLKKGETYGK